jgi:hypothetical protein
MATTFGINERLGAPGYMVPATGMSLAHPNGRFPPDLPIRRLHPEGQVRGIKSGARRQG